ncbi:MAG: EFR1 family ferrodoxin [Spirochaetia bacterium]
MNKLLDIFRRKKDPPKPKKIRILYFSGTGNSAWTAQKAAEKLRGLGNTVDIDNIEDLVDDQVLLTGCHMLGLFFPVHTSYPPEPMKNVIASLPRVNKLPLFAVTTAAYAAGDTAVHSVKALRKKGYKPFLLTNVMMGNNLHLPKLSPLRVTSQEKMRDKLKKADAKLDILCQAIHQKVGFITGNSPLGVLLGITQRIAADQFIDKAFTGFTADENCIQCGWCVRNCPVKAVEMSDSGPVFGDGCVLCMRCYSFCPVQAILYTEKTRDREKYKRYKGPEGKRFPSA